MAFSDSIFSLSTLALLFCFCIYHDIDSGSFFFHILMYIVKVLYALLRVRISLSAGFFRKEAKRNESYAL